MRKFYSTKAFLSLDKRLNIFMRLPFDITSMSQEEGLSRVEVNS